MNLKREKEEITLPSGSDSDYWKVAFFIQSEVLTIKKLFFSKIKNINNIQHETISNRTFYVWFFFHLVSDAVGDFT